MNKTGGRGWKEGRPNERTNRWLNGQIDERTNQREMDGWIMDEWRKDLMSNEWMNGRNTDRLLACFLLVVKQVCSRQLAGQWELWVSSGQSFICLSTLDGGKYIFRASWVSGPVLADLSIPWQFKNVGGPVLFVSFCGLRRKKLL